MPWRILLLTCVASASLGLAPRANPYQLAGHYYTVSVLVHAVLPQISPADARLIAFCAQLPDESSDLDAVVVYKSLIVHSPGAWWQWATSEKYDSPWTRRMITTQQLLHGLTGGPASQVQAVALQVLDKLWQQARPGQGSAASRPVNLCALGFGFHLYGDSFAHRVMGDYGTDDPDLVYSTGMGHARDLHYPDLPLCSRLTSAPRSFKHCEADDKGRFQAWQGAWTHAAEILGTAEAKGSLPPGVVHAVTAQVLALDTGADDSNLWNEVQMEHILAQNAAVAAADVEFFSKHSSDESCDRTLADAFSGQLLGSVAKFNCTAVWTAYQKVAQAEFDRSQKARADLRFRSPSDPYIDPLMP